MGARADKSERPTCFFCADGRTRRRESERPTCFFCAGRDHVRSLRRYHVGAAGENDALKGDGTLAAPPADQSSGAAAKVAWLTRCAPVL